MPIPKTPPPPPATFIDPNSEAAERTRRRIMNTQSTAGDFFVPMAGALLLFGFVMLISYASDAVFGTAQDRWLNKCELHASRGQCLEIYKETK